LFEAQSAENPARLDGASSAGESDGTSSRPSILSFERTPPCPRRGSSFRSNSKGATVVLLIVRGAERRELSSDSIETYVNSSHRSAYGGYSSNGKKISLPLKR